MGCDGAADPNMMPTMTVDKGAISFVMNGANIMCQGFTSKGGRIDCSLEAGSPVVSVVCCFAHGVYTEDSGRCLG